MDAMTTKVNPLRMEEHDILNLIQYEGRFSFNVSSDAVLNSKIFIELCNYHDEKVTKHLNDVELYSNEVRIQDIKSICNIISNLPNLELLSFRGKFMKKGPINCFQIQTSKLVNLNYVNLSNNQFEEIPNCVFELLTLKRLDLSHCNINHISKDIKKLINLVELNLQKNRIKNIPAEIKNLEKLERINLCKNEISKFSNLCSLSSLKQISINENKLVGLIHENIYHLKLLEVMKIRHNSIDSISDDFCLLPNLQTLDFSFNRVRILSDKIFALDCIIYHGNPIGENESMLKKLNLDEENIQIQEYNDCTLSIDVLNPATFILPCGVEILTTQGIFEENFKLEVQLLSGHQHTFQLSPTEQLLSNILNLNPSGTQFKNPLLIKIPFQFAREDQQFREVVIRCISNEDSSNDLLTTIDEDKACCEVFHFSKFAVISRLIQKTQIVKDREELLYSDVYPETKLKFPKECVPQETRITMQILQVEANEITQATGNPLAAASNVLIIRVWPPNTVFSKPVRVTMSLPLKLMGNLSSKKLHLLRSHTEAMNWEDISNEVDIQYSGTTASFNTTSFSKLWLVTEVVCGVARRIYRRLITYKVQFIAMQRTTAPSLVIAQCLQHGHADDRIAKLKTSGYIGDDPITPICEMMEGDRYCCKVVGEIKQRIFDDTDNQISGIFRSQYPPDKTGFERFFIEPCNSGFDKNATGFVNFYLIEKTEPTTKALESVKISPCNMATKRKVNDEYFVTMDTADHDNQANDDDISKKLFFDKVPLILEPKHGEEVFIPESKPSELNYKGLGTGLFRDTILRGIARDIGKEWRIIGTYLGITHASMDRIELDHAGNALEQQYRVLKLWAQMHASDDDSVEKFSEALELAGRTDLSMKIKKLHQAGEEAFLQSAKRQKQ